MSSFTILVQDFSHSYTLGWIGYFVLHLFTSLWFKARHPELTSRTADSLDRATVHGATPEAIGAFFQLYEALYVKHSLEGKKPHLIYNCDETGFGDKPRSREKWPPKLPGGSRCNTSESSHGVEGECEASHSFASLCITSDEYFNLLVEKETEEKEKEEKRQAQEAKRQKKQAPPPTEDGEHSAVCRRVVPPGSEDEAIDERVQCDLCQLWFHLMCAEVEALP
ncbi:hypothetical protein QQF64_023753 [Cirrhinus molitorella]|uniref:Zinc finger PHD-type domain-containing protein n=1 Tax=Cirrhinus molitorella TaxID=172907 RepID=A0ABR3NJA3_9TELE